MKTKFFSFLFILGLLGAQAPAQARSLMPTRWQAELTHVNLDEKLPYAQQVTGAHLGLDYVKGKATLIMPRYPHCEPGQLCSRIAYMPVVIELPIVGRKVDDCGARLVLARVDRRMVDGALEQLVIRDNTTNRCPTFAALPSTEVVYTTDVMSREGEVKTRSTLSGDRLRPDYTQVPENGSELEQE